MRGKKYYFTQSEIEPTQGENEMNIGKLKILLWLQTIFDDHLWLAIILSAILYDSYYEKSLIKSTWRLATETGHH